MCQKLVLTWKPTVAAAVKAVAVMFLATKLSLNPQTIYQKRLRDYCSDENLCFRNTRQSDALKCEIFRSLSYRKSLVCLVFALGFE